MPVFTTKNNCRTIKINSKETFICYFQIHIEVTFAEKITYTNFFRHHFLPDNIFFHTFKILRQKSFKHQTFFRHPFLRHIFSGQHIFQTQQ